MPDKYMKKAVEDFIVQRINDHSRNVSTELQKAWDRFEDDCRKLKETVSDENMHLFTACENAHMQLEGETLNYYYRTGFSDAVLFLLTWRDNGWN